MSMFFMLLIVFPVISVILGIMGVIIFRNVYVSPALVFVASMMAMVMVFNDSFLIWVFVYTLLAIVSGVIVKAVS